MSLPVKVSGAAAQEILEIQRYLEEANVGAGVRFRTDLERCLQIIQQYPGGARIRYRNYRSIPIEAFSFHLIYAVRSNCIVVHHVRHMRQRPLKRYFGR
ncbi:MAG: type II toxin-antitoxin system RelE/ParE family toxin [Flavobacteriales bacterium]|nr:type II toxin-antitoxin system RelE/ParE family toxin [Flavobacteriales bacterium]